MWSRALLPVAAVPLAIALQRRKAPTCFNVFTWVALWLGLKVEIDSLFERRFLHLGQSTPCCARWFVGWQKKANGVKSKIVFIAFVSAMGQETCSRVSKESKHDPQTKASCHWHWVWCCDFSGSYSVEALQEPVSRPSRCREQDRLCTLLWTHILK